MNVHLMDAHAGKSNCPAPESSTPDSVVGCDGHTSELTSGVLVMAFLVTTSCPGCMKNIAIRAEEAGYLFLLQLLKHTGGLAFD